MRERVSLGKVSRQSFSNPLTTWRFRASERKAINLVQSRSLDRSRNRGGGGSLYITVTGRIVRFMPYCTQKRRLTTEEDCVLLCLKEGPDAGDQHSSTSYD